jgi:lipopolysaccharide export system protein LptA
MPILQVKRRTYDGKVFWPAGTTQINADLLIPNKDNSFTATGNVKSKMEGLIANADKLEYDDVKKTAKYTGAVYSERKDSKNGTMKLNASDMTIYIDTEDSGKIPQPEGPSRGQFPETRSQWSCQYDAGTRRVRVIIWCTTTLQMR